MSASWVVGSLLIVGPLFLVGCVAIGVLGFNPERAQAIRNAEALPQVVIEEIRHVHIKRPDRFRHDRLDHHPFYVAALAGAFFYAVCIFLGAAPTSNVLSMGPATRFTLSACFLIGASLALSGAVMGAQIGHHVAFRGIKDNLTASILADDIRLPYTFGACGMFAVSISMGLYAETSFRSTAGSLGGWLTLCLAGASALMLVAFLFRIRRYSRARTTIIDAAVILIERGDGHVGD